MTFSRPAVHVYEDIVSVSTSLDTPYFYLCIVGPSYQVVSNIKSSDYSAAEAYTSSLVSIEDGVTADTSSVAITFKNARAKIWPMTADLSSEVTVDNTDTITKIKVAEANKTTQPFNTAVVKAGDLVYITYTVSGVATSYTSSVQSVAEDGVTISLARNLVSPAAEATIKASIERSVSDTLTIDTKLFTVDAAAIHDITQKVAGSVTTKLDSLDRVVTYANVYLSYRALRTGIAGDFIDIKSQADIKANLGAADVNNPLATAAELALTNGTVAFKVLPITEDSKAGYITALNMLSTNESIYIIVPLTQDRDVISAYAAHCTTMSTAQKGKWRIVYANMEMPSTKVMVELNDGTLAKGTEAEGDNIATNILKDLANGTFITSGIRATDYVDVYTSDNSPVYQYSLKITEVVNETVLKTATVKYTATDEGYVADTAAAQVISTDTDCQYQITRVLTHADLANAMVEVAAGFANKRLRLIEPDTIMLSINSVDYIVPGYYLAVAYGMLRAALPPHQGFTNYPISGVKRIYRSNKVFTDDELDVMAGGGIFWVVQDTNDSNPYCIYQTTTDTTQLETIEDSIVSDIDYCAKFYKANLKAVIGKFNVNTISVKYVKTVINDITDRLKRTSYQYIGPVLTSGSLKSITTQADTITPVIVISIPYPVNAVELYMEI